VRIVRTDRISARRYRMRPSVRASVRAMVRPSVRAMVAAVALSSAIMAPSAGCGAPVSTPASAASAPPAGSASAAAPAPRAPAIEWVHDDMTHAYAVARKSRRLVFVDVWAPWCHTCLAMQEGPLADGRIAAYADRFVFVALDSDRERAATFLEAHAVRAWPTFFVIEPGPSVGEGKVLGAIAGAASVDELVAMLDGALSTHDGDGALARASAAYARRDYSIAAEAYEGFVRTASPTLPRLSEARLGWIRSLHASRSFEPCVDVGLAEAAEVTGAAAPTDFLYYLGECAAQLPAGEKQDRARALVLERLTALTAAPPPDASVDDRADAWAQLAQARRAGGDPAGAKQADEARLSVLEAAARAARTPAEQAVYDYLRAGGYLALGRGDEAVAMLEERERQLPESYEPPARLAWVLHELGRDAEAKVAVERAIARAYGPRRLRYLRLKADILGRLGDDVGRLATLREELAAHEALPRGQRDDAKLDALRALVDAAEKPRP
jgi:thioredoxin-like negative regulator of GroEL